MQIAGIAKRFTNYVTGQKKTKVPEKITNEMLESLKPIVEDVKKQDWGNSISRSMEWRPKSPKRFNDTVEGFYTNSPSCETMRISDGVNCIVINTTTGEILNKYKSSPFMSLKSLLRKMQAVIAKYPNK